MPETDRRQFMMLGAGALAAPAVFRSRRRRVPAWGLGLDEIAARFRNTPREDALEAALELHGRGSSYRDLLGGVFLAGVHDVSPHPVGFKFHAVLMVSSAYQIAEAVPPEDRLLPVLFNLDDYKRSQARDVQEGDWQLSPLSEAALRPLDDPAAAFRAAMDAWQPDEAERAVVQLHASRSLDDLFEEIWTYGARSFGNIGHKAIYAAQAYRTLQQIGWRHGAPVLRSLVQALLDSPSNRADQSFTANRKLAASLRDDWERGGGDPAASRAILAALRTADAEGAARKTVEANRKGASPAAVWDGYRLFAFELLMRIPGLLAVHPSTTINALHFAYRTARDDGTRRLLLLQAATWLVLFREFLSGRGMDMDGPGIDAIGLSDERVAAPEILATAGDDRARGAALAAGAFSRGRTVELADEVRRLLMRKAREHHDYKFAAAALEEIGLAHRDVAPLLMGASLFYLRTPDQPDGAVYRRARPLLGR